MPLEEFRDPVPREKRAKELVGRKWSVKELRRKNFEDLHKLWLVLYKERNMLLTERQISRRRNIIFPQPERFRKVQKSMGAIKYVLNERKQERIKAHHERKAQEAALQQQQKEEVAAAASSKSKEIINELHDQSDVVDNEEEQILDEPREVLENEGTSHSQQPNEGEENDVTNELQKQSDTLNKEEFHQPNGQELAADSSGDKEELTTDLEGPREVGGDKEEQDLDETLEVMESQGTLESEQPNEGEENYVKHELQEQSDMENMEKVHDANDQIISEKKNEAQESGEKDTKTGEEDFENNGTVGGNPKPDMAKADVTSDVAKAGDDKKPVWVIFLVDVVF